MLSMYVNKNRSDWDEQLSFVLMACRSTMHESTGCRPNMLMLNRECSLPIDIIAGNPPVHTETQCQIQYLEWLTYTMTNTSNIAFKSLEKAATLQKKYYEAGLKVRQYSQQNFIWRWELPLAALTLGLVWTGPYKGLRKLSSVNYEVQRDPKTKPIVLYVDDIKAYLGEGTPLTWQTPDQNIHMHMNQDSTLSDLEEHHNENQVEKVQEPEPYRTRYGSQIRPPDYYNP